MARVSVVTPCYNCAKYIGRTIESLIAQIYEDWELIVVDDESNDGSLNAAALTSGTDKRISLVRQRHGGASKARNYGYSLCSSETDLVLFLDADDLLMPEMLSILVRHLDTHPSASLVGCEYELIDENGAALEEQFDPVAPWRYVQRAGRAVEVLPDEPRTPFESLYCWSRFLPSATVLRRQQFERCGKWDEDFGQPGEDWDLFLRMALIGEAHFLNRRLLGYRRHGGQSTASPESVARQTERLYAKWAAPEEFAKGYEEHVADAARFKRELFEPHIWSVWARDAFRRKDYRDSIRCWAKSIKQGMNLR